MTIHARCKMERSIKHHIDCGRCLLRFLGWACIFITLFSYPFSAVFQSLKPGCRDQSPSPSCNTTVAGSPPFDSTVGSGDENPDPYAAAQSAYLAGYYCVPGYPNGTPGYDCPAGSGPYKAALHGYECVPDYPVGPPGYFCPLGYGPFSNHVSGYQESWDGRQESRSGAQESAQSASAAQGQPATEAINGQETDKKILSQSECECECDKDIKMATELEDDLEDDSDDDSEEGQKVEATKLEEEINKLFEIENERNMIFRSQRVEEFWNRKAAEWRRMKEERQEDSLEHKRAEEEPPVQDGGNTLYSFLFGKYGITLGIVFSLFIGFIPFIATLDSDEMGEEQKRGEAAQKGSTSMKITEARERCETLRDERRRWEELRKQGRLRTCL
ncbi:hypothetical protein V8F06_004868 [Rhypophila decipiens]